MKSRRAEFDLRQRYSYLRQWCSFTVTDLYRKLIRSPNKGCWDFSNSIRSRWLDCAISPSWFAQCRRSLNAWGRLTSLAYFCTDWSSRCPGRRQREGKWHQYWLTRSYQYHGSKVFSVCSSYTSSPSVRYYLRYFLWHRLQYCVYNSGYHYQKFLMLEFSIKK